MATIDYKKKYEQALEKVRVMLGTGDYTRESLEYVFPELKESEDERIKRILKAIVEKMALHLHDVFTEEEFQCFDAWSYAWLEKPEEHSLSDVAKEVTKDKETAISFLKSCGIMDENGELAEKYRIKQGEQKPAEQSEKYIADVFEKVGLAKIAREQSNDNLTNALQDAMIELSKFIPTIRT